MKKVAITGGSGFLGINLIRDLLDRGVEIVSLDIAEFDYPEAAQIKTLQGDIRDTEALRKAFKGVDAVIHTAAALPLYPAKEIFSVEVDGTRSVVETAVEMNVPRLVHISSTAVYGVPDHHPLLETDPVIGVGPYGQAKIDAEEIVKASREAICATILRPKSFIGPERLGVFALLYDWAITGHNFPIPGKGNNLYQYLDVSDLCDAIWLTLVSDPEIANDTFNIGAAEFGTFKSDFQAVLDEAGFDKKVISLPAMPAVWVLRLLDRIGLSPLYPWVYETAVKDSYVSIEKAQSRLGFAPKFSNRDALTRNLHWYRDNLSSFEGKTGISHRVPWKQGALAFAKFLFR